MLQKKFSGHSEVASRGRLRQCSRGKTETQANAGLSRSDHFRRANTSNWMRAFDPAEYEACRNAESESPLDLLQG